MRVIEATRRSGVAIASDRTIRAAAQIMELGHGARSMTAIALDRFETCHHPSFAHPQLAPHNPGRAPPHRNTPSRSARHRQERR